MAVFRQLKFKHVWVLPAMVVRVIDGDTIVIHTEVMPGLVLHEAHLRVEGINAPEMNTPAGREAKEFVEHLLPVNAVVRVTMRDTDKYGRALGKVQLLDGRDLSQVMIDTQHAVPYNP